MQYKNEFDNRPPKGGMIIIPPFFGGKPDKDELMNFPPLKPDKDDEKLKVKIKSSYDDEFVVVGSDGYLYATSEKTNKNGIFKLIIDKDKVMLRQVDGNFIRVDDRDFLVADAKKKNATVFKVYKTDDKEYVLKAPNGYFVRVRDKDNKLVAKAEKAGKKTKFKFKVVD